MKYILKVSNMADKEPFSVFNDLSLNSNLTHIFITMTYSMRQNTLNAYLFNKTVNYYCPFLLDDRLWNIYTILCLYISILEWYNLNRFCNN